MLRTYRLALNKVAFTNVLNHAKPNNPINKEVVCRIDRNALEVHLTLF